MQIKLEQIGWNFINDCPAGSVHSVFKHACNLKTRGLKALISSNAPMTAWAARISDPCPPFTELLYPGLKFIIRNNHIIFDNKTDFIFPRQFWKNDTLSGNLIASPQIRKILLDCVKKTAKTGLCACIFNYHTEKGISDLYANIIFENASQLEKAWQNQDISLMTQKAHNLLGTGPGLTPSGDDFLIGWLGGKFCLSPNGSRDKTLLEIGKKLTTSLQVRTTEVSAAFVRHACAGSFSELFPLLEKTLFKPDARKIYQVIDKLVNFGATSGSDALAGFLAALNIIIFQRNRVFCV